jgi:hypothetical protein
MNTQDIRRQSVSGDHAFRLPRDIARLEGPLQLHDGHVIHVRVIRPHDDEQLRAFHRHLSPDAIMFRFFHMLPELPAPDAERFTHVDYVNRMALLATTGSAAPEEILGVVRYDRTEDTTAEVAYARTKGIATFVAITMGSNARMIEVLRNSGFPMTTRYSEGTLEVHLDITKPPVFPGSP